MKNIIFGTVMLFVCISFPSCFFDRDGNKGLLHVVASETDLDDDDGNRRSGSRNSSSQLCEDDSGCMDVCEDVYDDDDEEEDEWKVELCGEVRYSLASQFEDILDILEEPYDSNLRSIDAKAFDKFLDVSVKPWVNAAEDLGDSESETVLAWIAKEKKISSAITSAYTNYEDFDKYVGVSELFDEIDGGSGCSNFCTAVSDDSKAIVGESTTFLDIIKKERNTSAGNIVCDLCYQKCNAGMQTQCAQLNTYCTTNTGIEYGCYQRNNP